METEFENLKQTIINFAKQSNACKDEYSRALLSNNAPEICEVIKRNWMWCYNSGLIKAIAKDFLKVLNKNDIFYNQNTDMGFVFVDSYVECIGGCATAYIAGYATVKDVRDSATVKGVRDSATVVNVRDSATIKFVQDSAKVVNVMDSATVEYVCDSATVVNVWNFATVLNVWDSATVENVRDFAKVVNVRDFTKVVNVMDSATVLNRY